MHYSRTVRAHCRTALAVIFLFSFTFWLAGQSTNVSIGPQPAWVRSVEWNLSPVPGTNEASEGTHYLLYERQQNPGLKENFERTVLLMQNEAGVQDSGNLSFDFDPSYQELILHRVQIHRNGRVLERLDRSKLRIIQPEARLTGHVLTGELTAVLFVEDLRVGDALEYAYTTRGANPIWGGHFSTRFVVQSSVPVDRQRVRLVWSSASPLHMRQHLTKELPVKTVANGKTDYTWDFTNVTAIVQEDFTPIGFEPYPYVEFSDFDSWERVVEWALPLYATAETNLPPELAKLIDQWRRSGSSDEERARLALQFVQDELRYTGLELGPDSYRPAHPFETFERRFGDCKGKVSLLGTILRAMNLEAWPALVSTSVREGVARRLASPFAFNHVILKVNLDGRAIWLDPTISHQGGRLETRHLPQLGKALVVQKGVLSLEDIPRSNKTVSRQQATSAFTIADYKSPVPLTVTTTYRGSGADSMRETLARTDAKQLVKDYLNFYARYYPGIKDVRPLEVSDDRTQNILAVTEHYRITNLWKLDQSSNRWEAAFYAETLQDALTDPTTRLRTRPLWISFPLRREQEVVVHLPDRDWDIPERTEEVTHEAFYFRYRRKFSGSTVRFQYECETRAREVPVEQVANYLAKLGQMENLLADSLQRPNNAPRAILARMNWLMVVVAGFGAGAALLGGLWIWRSTRHPILLPPLLPGEYKLSGLNGWLILVGIGLCSAPIARVAQIVQHWQGFFSVDVWQSVAMPGGEQYHPLYAPILIFEVLGNVLLLGLNVLAIGLFFAKRRPFPRTFIAFLVGSAAFLWVDELFGGMIPVVASASDASSRRELVRATVGAVIWSAYMVKSRRVRATFREPSIPNPPPIPTASV